jgi:hypothetical protein
MRVLGLNLLIAIALFGVAYVNSDRQQVVDAYRGFVQAYASGNPYAICAAQHPDSRRGDTIEACAEDLARYFSKNPQGELARRYRTLLDAGVVVTDMDDGSAMLRVAGCTLEVLELDFERARDGRWYERTIVDAFSFGPVSPCREGGEIPPPQLAWTWQERNWR